MSRPRTTLDRRVRLAPSPRLPLAPAAAPRPDAGFSVVVVTATIVVLLILGLSLAAMVSENAGLSVHHLDSNRAFYAAQAGVEYAIVKLSGTPSWGGLPLPGKNVGKASFWIAAPDSLDEAGRPLPPGQRRIVSTGRSGGAERVVQVRVSTAGMSTQVGTGRSGYEGDGGPATAATLSNAAGVAVGPDGSLYVADTDNHAIRRVDAATLEIVTVAGTGSPGRTGDGAPATSARLQFPEDVAVAPNGDLYIADTMNHAIRRVAHATGLMTTIAGTGSPGSSGDGGPATSARLKHPSGVSLAANGDLYIADTSNNKIRKVSADTGIITTVAGTGAAGFSGDGGSAGAARLRGPRGVEIASNGDVYIADTSNHVVRRVEAASGVIATVAGTGSAGYSGDGGAAAAATLKAPVSVTVRANGDVYVADTGNHAVRAFTVGGAITTVAGTGVAGFDGDGGPPRRARLAAPSGVAVGPTGLLYIADTVNRRVRVAGGGLSVVGWTESRS